MRNDPESERGQGHVTYFLNFGTSDSITFKRMKLDSSFFSLLDRPWQVLHKGRWMTPKGCGQGHVSYFWSNGTDTCVTQDIFIVKIKLLLLLLLLREHTALPSPRSWWEGALVVVAALPRTPPCSQQICLREKWVRWRLVRVMPTCGEVTCWRCARDDED